MSAATSALEIFQAEGDKSSIRNFHMSSPRAKTACSLWNNTIFSVHLLNKYLLNVNYMPGALLCPGNKVISKTAKSYLSPLVYTNVNSFPGF
jgi:hypothetical protein